MQPKVLYIITQADGGGAQKYVLALAKHFGGGIAAGDEAHSLFEYAKARAIDSYKLKHLKRNIHLWHDLLAIFEIRNLIKKIKPDIVHLNSTKAGFLGSLAGKLAGAKVIFTAHGFRFLEPLPSLSRFFYKWVEKIARYFSDYIIAVSDVDKKSAIDNNLITANKISTIHNGIGKIDFLSKEEAIKKLGLQTDKKIIGTISNPYKTKGLDVLIEAFPMMSPKAINGSYIGIIGSGPETENLKNQISEAGLDEKIKLLGNIPDAAKNLKAFDSFVLPSRKEGLPFALLEAMQAGLSTTTTSVGGIPEAIANATVAVPPDDSQALARGMEQATFSEEVKTKNSQKALERSKLFTEEKMLEETAKIYEKVLKS